jgi:hypothetical protein
MQVNWVCGVVLEAEIGRLQMENEFQKAAVA